MNIITLERNDEILTILAEECAEVIQMCSKIRRFGLDAPNKELLAKELADLQCMIDLVYEYKIIDNTRTVNLIDNKRKKLKLYSSIFNHD